MKILKIITACLLVVLSFSSCSSDDEENGNGITSSAKKRLVLIESNNSDGDYYQSIKIEYNTDNKVSRIVETTPSSNFRHEYIYLYKEKNIVIRSANLKSNGEHIIQNDSLYLNKDGNVIYLVINGDRSSSTTPFYNQRSYEYTNGYLTKVDYLDLDDRYKYFHEFKNDVMVKNSFYEDGIDYTDILNKGNLFLAYDGFDTRYRDLLFSGLAGKPSKYLPKKGYGYEYKNDSHDFKYTLDKEGYVLKMDLISNNDSDYNEYYTFTYETVK